MATNERPALNLFLIGAPKTGSTLLANLLGLHPDVYMAEGKDRNFFATDLALAAASREEPLYWEMFDDWDGEARVGEASVFYLYSDAALREIAARFPDAVILILVRNPVDLVHSYHRQMVFIGAQPVEDFDAVVLGRDGGPPVDDTDPEPPADREAVERAGRLDPRLLDYGFVGRLSPRIERWREAFGRERVELILFDDLVSRTEEVLRDLFQRLGVDPAADVDLESVMGDKMARNPHKVRRSEALREAIHGPGPWLRRIVRALIPSTRLRGLVAGFLDRHNRTFVERRGVTSEARAHLERVFEPEIGRLEELFGRDLGHWRVLRE